MPAATYENVVNAEHVYADLEDSDLSAGWREVGRLLSGRDYRCLIVKIGRAQRFYGC